MPEMSDHETIPRHIAISPDGNRRWANRHGLTPRQGHQAGYEVFKTVVFALADYQIPYISAHLITTETWKRSPEEVRWLLELVLRPAGDDAEEFANHGVTVRYVGRRAALPVNQQETIRRAESGNPSNPTMLLLGVDYGGRAELVDVVRRCIEDGISPRDVDDNARSERQYVPEVPDIDLFVRTAEQRLSNFMLWRLAYSEILFLDKCWPEITRADIDWLLAEWATRKRSFGGNLSERD
jgi:undecaprenyl diphosphate synthase